MSASDNKASQTLLGSKDFLLILNASLGKILSFKWVVPPFDSGQFPTTDTDPKGNSCSTVAVRKS